MIAEILNRDVVLSQVATLKESLSKHPSKRHKGISNKELLAAIEGAEEKEESASTGQSGFELPEGDRRGEEVRTLSDFSFFSRDPILSMLQTILELDAKRGVERKQLQLKVVPDERRGVVRGGREAMPLITDETFGYEPTRARMTDRRLFEKYSIQTLDGSNRNSLKG